jgi:predicted PurR-regulated permease PerM
MLALDGKTARMTWTVCFVVAVLAGLYLIRRTLLVLIFALLLAYLMAPAVSLLDRFAARRIPRTLSLAIVYILLLSVVVAAGVGIGRLVFDDLVNLARNFPHYLESTEPFLPRWLEPYQEQIRQWLKESMEPEAKQVVPFLQQTVLQLVNVAGNLLLVVLVPILSFFLLKDATGIRDLVLSQIDNAKTRELAETIIASVHAMLMEYVRAMVLLSLCTFLVYWIFLGWIGVPNAAALASLAGVLEFVPAAGPLAASVTILLISGFAGFPHLLAIIVFLVVYRLILDYAILPQIMSAGVSLSPMVVVLGILAGEQIGGITGMFLSIPALATARVVYISYRQAKETV